MIGLLRRHRGERRPQQTMVAVWFTDDEHAHLADIARQAGKAEPTVLREAFLRAGRLLAVLEGEDIERRVEELRAFEAEYRARLLAFLEDEARKLRAGYCGD